MLLLLIVNLAAVLLLQAGVWLWSLKKRDASLADLFWGPNFVLIAALTAAHAGREGWRVWLLLIMVVVWAARLSAYLTHRNRGKPEDRRYAAMRARHGARFPWVSLVTVFGLQGALSWIIALPVQVGMPGPGGFGLLPAAGVALWLAGLSIETFADLQLARFKADPANDGRVMDRGLWRYSRHPNYFGECLVWWGVYLVAALPGTWLWTLVSPVLMTVLLLKVSGVSLLERSLQGRLPAYQDYAARTSAFIPWPPREKSS